MDRIVAGKLFQSEGALNIEACLPNSLETAGTEKRAGKNVSIGNLKRRVSLIALDKVGS